MPAYTETEFFNHFRISREVFRNIVAEYESSNFYKRNMSGQYGQINANDQVINYIFE